MATSLKNGTRPPARGKMGTVRRTIRHLGPHVGVVGTIKVETGVPSKKEIVRHVREAISRGDVDEAARWAARFRAFYGWGPREKMTKSGLRRAIWKSQGDAHARRQVDYRRDLQPDVYAATIAFLRAFFRQHESGRGLRPQTLGDVRRIERDRQEFVIGWAVSTHEIHNACAGEHEGNA